MKLVCPNCGAQYAVDDQMIPPAGRDVQCSNCSHTWFQLHADQDADLADELGYDLPLDGQEADLPDAPASEPTLAEDRPPAPPRRARDDRVFNVLREEAARETAARAREAQAAIETQPELDMSLPEASRAPRREPEATPSRDDTPPSQLLDHSEEAQLAAAATLAGRSAARRDLLPDIEEINSTLRPGETPAEAEAADQQQASLAAQRRQKSGFRIGFSTMAICAVVALGLYLHAPKVANLLPFTEPALREYVDFVDQGRIWLDKSLLTAVGAGKSEDS